MALKTQKFKADVGSEEVHLLRTQVNALTAYVTALNAAVAAATDIASLQTGVAAIDVSALRKLVATPEIKDFPLVAAV